MADRGLGDVQLLGGVVKLACRAAASKARKAFKGSCERLMATFRS